LERPEAASLLQRAGNEVKSAIAMHRLGIELGDAQRRLTEAGGSLRVVLNGV
jgi:N-acetylmuramic acid 6-phosphate (MurNAc-6-P) etherase